MSRITYTIMIVFLLLIQQVISGCSTTVTKDLQKDNLHKIEVDLVSQNLYQNKCALCHELPDINEYSQMSGQVLLTTLTIQRPPESL